MVAAIPSLPSLLLGPFATAAAQAANDDRVLVVVQLSGGNDGLNTVIPYGDDEYGRNRSSLRWTAEKLHLIDSQLGFHPRMKGFSRLYEEGLLSIVQGVGCEDLPRNHEEAMRVWHSASPDCLGCPAGWLGRTGDSIWDISEAQSKVAFVGPITRPPAMNAERVVVPSIRSLDDLTLHSMPGESTGASKRTPADSGNPLLTFVQESMQRSYSNSRKILAVAEATAGQSEYPSFGFARDLRVVAQMIRAGNGVRIFFTELGGEGFGGFDNHANQLDNHGSLLHQLSEGVAAFADDLKRDGLLDNVMLMTFSEFGRTLEENGRRGTGHGNAAPVFLVGGKLKGGLVGPHPSLTELDNGAPQFHTDFRRVYATALDRWLGFDSTEVLGGQFEPLAVFDA